eukprot:PhF_6_TR29433/c0_g1_i1/m.43574
MKAKTVFLFIFSFSVFHVLHRLGSEPIPRNWENQIPVYTTRNDHKDFEFSSKKQQNNKAASPNLNDEFFADFEDTEAPMTDAPFQAKNNNNNFRPNKNQQGNNRIRKEKTGMSWNAIQNASGELQTLIMFRRKYIRVKRAEGNWADTLQDVIAFEKLMQPLLLKFERSIIKRHLDAAVQLGMFSTYAVDKNDVVDEGGYNAIKKFLQNKGYFHRYELTAELVEVLLATSKVTWFGLNHDYPKVNEFIFEFPQMVVTLESQTMASLLLSYQLNISSNSMVKIACPVTRICMSPWYQQQLRTFVHSSANFLFTDKLEASDPSVHVAVVHDAVVFTSRRNNTNIRQPWNIAWLYSLFTVTEVLSITSPTKCRQGDDEYENDAVYRSPAGFTILFVWGNCSKSSASTPLLIFPPNMSRSLLNNFTDMWSLIRDTIEIELIEFTERTELLKQVGEGTMYGMPSGELQRILLTPLYHWGYLGMSDPDEPYPYYLRPHLKEVVLMTSFRHILGGVFRGEIRYKYYYLSDDVRGKEGMLSSRFDPPFSRGYVNNSILTLYRRAGTSQYFSAVLIHAVNQFLKTKSSMGVLNRTFRVADVGCGSGLYGAELMRHFMEEEPFTIFVDFYEIDKVLEEAKWLVNTAYGAAEHRARFFPWNATSDKNQLRGGDGVYDVVWVSFTWFHFGGVHVDRIVSELVKSLKPGGVVYIHDTIPGAVPTEPYGVSLDTLNAFQVMYRKMNLDTAEWTADSVRQMFKRHGLDHFAHFSSSNKITSSSVGCKPPYCEETLKALAQPWTVRSDENHNKIDVIRERRPRLVYVRNVLTPEVCNRIVRILTENFNAYPHLWLSGANGAYGRTAELFSDHKACTPASPDAQNLTFLCPVVRKAVMQ